MGKKEVSNGHIEPYTLTNKQIKEKIEDSISYNHSKYKNLKVLFDNKPENSNKLPFSDYKISIAQELYENALFIKELQEYNLIEETIIEDPPEEMEIMEVVIEEEPEIDILEEIYDFDEEGRKPKKGRSRAKIKQVDTASIIAKIKAEAIIKNKGKKVITRRDINKELKPYMLKRNSMGTINDDTLTSIDIYLNAVNKIESNLTSSESQQNDKPLELDLDDILNDLDK